MTTLDEAQKASEDSADTKPLSELQQEVFEFLKSYVHETGRWPTYERVCDHFGWSSENSFRQILDALVRKNWLRREKEGVYRFIGGQCCPHCGSKI